MRVFIFSDFLYEWSLVLVAESLPKALTKLDELITQSPNHVAGRLLRGILLGDNVDMRRSRDDFIKADEIMRSQADDDNEVGSSLLQLRDYLLDRGLFPTEQEFLSPSLMPTPCLGARFRRFPDSGRIHQHLRHG